MENSGFNPFPVRQFSKQQVEALFGSKADSKLAQKTKMENPGLYDAIRKQAVADGLAAPVPVPYAAWRMPTERNFSDEEIALRARYSEQDCRDVFCKPNGSGATNAGTLHQTDPHKYAELRAAAVSYGLIPATQPAPVFHEHKSVKQEPEGFVLSDAIADKINLPRGTRVTTEQFAKITTILNEPAASDGTKE